MKGLHTLLYKSPEIAALIHTLSCFLTKSGFTQRSWLPSIFSNWKSAFIKKPHLPSILNRMTNLKVLHISNHGHGLRSLDWMLPHSRKVLVPLLHLPTLTRINLRRIHNFPLTDFIGCPNLGELDVDSFEYSPENAWEFPESLPPNPVLLDRLVVGNDLIAPRRILGRRPDGLPIIDFSTLKSIMFNQERLHSMKEIFGACKQLAEVEINLNDYPSSFQGLFAMLKPSLHSLTHLSLSTQTGDEPETEDPLAGLGYELEQMGNHNVIETIKLTVNIAADEDCTRGNKWGVLDRTLMRNPDQWPALREVSLAIVIVQYHTVGEHELEDALQKLPGSQFPKLGANKKVKFVFKVSCKDVYGAE